MSDVAAEPASTQIPHDLQAQLSTYLALATEALKRDQKERAEKARAVAIQKRVVELSTWLALLLGYSILVGYLSSSTLIASLVDPAAVGRRIAALAEVPRQYEATVPGDVRSIIFSLVSAGFILVLRAASLRARSALGGMLFLAIATLSLLGLAAAFSTGIGGMLASIAGFVAILIVVHEFLRFLRRNVAASVRSQATRTWWQSVLARMGRRLHSIRHSLLPAGNARRMLFFVCIPVIAVTLIWVAATTDSRSGVLYWASRLSQVAVLIWFVWACVVTPAAIRIPLWSVPVWGAIVLTLFTYGPVAVLFAVAVLIVLVANVLIPALAERSVPPY